MTERNKKRVEGEKGSNRSDYRGFAPFLPLLVLAWGILWSCSSLPKNNGGVNTIKNQAAEYAKQGNVYFAQGDLVQAERYFKLALDSDFSVDNQYGIAAAYNSLGRVYLAAGNIDAATSAFDRAEQSANPPTTPQFQTLIVAIETGRAEILLVGNDFQGALTLLKKAEQLPLEAGSVEQADLYHDLGAAYKGTEDYSESLSYFNKAVAIHEKLGRTGLAASDLYMIASVYSKQQDYANAAKYAEEALSKDKLIENSAGIGSDLRALGIINEKLGNTQGAYDNYYSALQVFRTLNLAEPVQDLLGRLQTIAASLGKSDEANTYAEALKRMEAAK